MFSPRAEEDTMSSQSKVERWSRIIERQESSTSGMFSLLIEMREEMKRKDEQFREEVR